MTMPKHIAAETGMDALTHALESYLNHGMDGFTEVYCRGAIQDLLKWLPESCNAPSPRAREKVHYCQCMAGMSFANVGLGMVHGIAHSFGGIYDIAHGLANAVILPYALQYNSRDPRVREKLARLGDCTGGGDLIGRIIDLKEKLGIPGSFRDIIGVREFQTNFKPLVDYALETGTRANPVPMTRPEMERVVGAVYYGKEIDW